MNQRVVKCRKLGKELTGLTFKPVPGDLGDEIFEHISQQAWQAWLTHQTMLINEYRLNLMEPKAKEFLTQEMKKFLFGGESTLPPGYKAPENRNTQQD